jgi:membrane-associated phospholipid phosphatase
LDAAAWAFDQLLCGNGGNVDTLYETGIRLVILFQSVGWLETPMRFFTFLGTQPFFIFVMPVIYWCINAGLGIRVGFILLLGTGLNDLIKMGLITPRPYWISTQVKALSAEAAFGVPSGHAQTAAGVWGMLAAGIRRSWAWISASALILLIGLSRIYLGVHFPHDVLLGWLLGGLTLWAFLALWKRIAAWVKQRTFGQHLLLSLVLPAALVLGAGLFVIGLRNYTLPGEWMANATRAGEPLPAPVSMESPLTSAGALCGLSLGLALIRRMGGFKPSGPIWKRLVCLVVGLVGVFVLYLGLKAVLPADETLIGSSMRFLRYALLGFWISAGAPWLFAKLGLVRLQVT